MTEKSNMYKDYYFRVQKLFFRFDVLDWLLLTSAKNDVGKRKVTLEKPARLWSNKKSPLKTFRALILKKKKKLFIEKFSNIYTEKINYYNETVKLCGSLLTPELPANFSRANFGIINFSTKEWALADQ